MNAPVRRVAMATLVLFGLLLGTANWVQVVRAADYRDDSRNARVIVRTYERERGPMIVQGAADAAVAESQDTGGRLRYLRRYPGGEVYAPVTGFASLVYGNSGMEAAAERVLSGEDDRLFVERLSDLVTGREPQGGAVVLTLDPRVQEAAYAALGARRGAVVALDPRTGAVLALVSRPSFDPEQLSSHDPRAIRAAYEQLSAADGRPLRNRATSETYPPGSVFKIVTAAAALESGEYRADTAIPSPQVLDLPQTDAGLRNFGGGTCQAGDPAPLDQAFRFSCNTTFGRLGLDLGADALRRQAERFGVGEALEIPLTVARSAFPEDPNPPQTAQSAIGQFDVRLTPLQAALLAAGVANDGRVMRPYLVKEVRAPDLSVVDSASPEELSRAVSPETAEALTAMMELVVSSGSGTAAQVPGVRVAGKTGTAQQGEGEAPHAWFAGFAPAEAPRVAVAVLVEDGGSAGSEATGGRVAAPVARAVFEAVLNR